MRISFFGRLSAHCLFFLWALSCAKPHTLPNIRVSTGGLTVAALASGSEIIILGDLTDAKRVAGPIQVDYRGVKVVAFACVGRLVPEIVLKSTSAALPRDLLWYAQAGDCNFGGSANGLKKYVQRLWLLRSEGGYLRPNFDDTTIWIGLMKRFNSTAKTKDVLRLEFGRTLLSPRIYEDRPEDEHLLLSRVYPIINELVGAEYSHSLLLELHDQASPMLRSAICRQLALMGDECEFAKCDQTGWKDTAAYIREIQSLQNRRTQVAKLKLSEIIQAKDAPGLTHQEESVREILRLVCHYDSSVRSEARDLFRRMFPGRQLPGCLNCDASQQSARQH